MDEYEINEQDSQNGRTQIFTGDNLQVEVTNAEHRYIICPTIINIGENNE